MTIALTLSYGSTTVDINSTSCALAWGNYTPKPGAVEDLTVTESLELVLFGSGIAAIQTTIRGIEQALHQAREYQAKRSTNRVHINLTLTGGSAYRSEIMDGAVTPDARAIAWIEGSLFAKVQLSLTRANWWEGPEATLALTNRAGTGATAAIVNHQDAGATDDLYVEIAAAQVTGGIPTPAIVLYKNTTNDATLVDHLMVGHFADTAALGPPAAASLIFEGSGTSDANCSGGAYAALSWTGAAATQLATWTLASALFQQRAYKIIARLRDSTAYTDLYLQAKILQGATVIAETRWTLVEAGLSLVEIGSMHIPPFGWGAQVDLGDLTLALYEKRAGSDGSLTLDFLAALPQDSWRKFEAIAGLAYNETLIDDPVADTLATLYSTSSYKATQLLSEGRPILLQPGMKNFLYFLHDLTTGAAPIARTATVAIKIRPRRLTI